MPDRLAVGGDTPEAEPPPKDSRSGPSHPDRPHRFLPGKVLAERYRIIHALGQGGMGVVYQADDLVLGQTVALKFLQEAMGRYFAHFLFHEVRVARRISHPNVCRIYDIGEIEGLYFLSMEFIDGEDLATFLRRVGRLLPERSMAIGREICRGLGAIHEQGILHCDLKPANLMIDGDGRVRITDFGIAALAETQESRGVFRGTPAYMSPERLAGREPSIRSDLYALGLVLYELVTGERAAGRQEDPGGLLSSLEPPSRWVEGLDAEVEQMIWKCLAEDPDERPRSALEVATALGEGAAPVWQPAAGRVVPQRSHWQLVRMLGKGGFGEVWLAAHRKTRQRRVFKFCHDTARLSPLKREITLFRLLREELGERDDIVRILDWNFEEAPYFIESEYTQGGDLFEWAEGQGGVARVPLATRLEIAARVADALSAAHSVGVLHKDVKPSNILVEREASSEGEAPRIRLADFGIGRVLDEERLANVGITVMGLTETSTASGSSGTLLYRAPELYEGKPATVQADVYSLGVMLYQLAVGDLRCALGPGWEHDVTDELLREDIAAVVDRNPLRRLADVGTLASRLRALEKRREHRDGERRAIEEAKLHRRQLERAVRRRRLLSAVATVSLLVTAVVFFQSRRLAREAARNRNITRVAVAGEVLGRDPTRAARVLLEVEHPDRIPTAVSRMRQALQHKLALFELRHDDTLGSAAWSPSGERILTAAENGTLRLFRADGRGEPEVLSGCPEILTSAAWSPDGNRLATTCWDGTARVFRVGSAAVETLPLVHEGGEGSLRLAVWDPRGERLALTSVHGAVRVWRVSEGMSFPLEGHAGDVTQAAWSLDGRRLATASFDSTARVWELGESIPAGASHVLEHDGGKRVWTAVWSPDGERLITTSNDKTARIWDLRGDGVHTDPPLILTEHDSDVRVAAWSQDGKRVMTASRDQTVRVWSSSTGELLSVLEGHAGGLRAAAWSPDGEWILTAAEDGKARVWRVVEEGPESRAEIVLAGHDAYVKSALWSPDGEKILTMSGRTVRVWPAGSTLAEPGSGDPQVLARHGGRVRTAAWSPDGKTIATASQDTTARLWSVGTGARLFGPAREAAMFRGHEAPVRTVAWSADGQRLVTASEDGTARIWAAFGESDPLVLAGHRGALTGAAFDPSGRRVLTASEDGTACVWRTDDAGMSLVLGPYDTPLTTAVWSPDGGRVAAVSERSLVVRQIAADGSGAGEPLILAGHGASVRSAVWSPDGEHILTAAADGTARIWRLAKGSSGAPVILSHGPLTPVRTAAFDPRGELVVTGLDNGSVRVWRVDGSLLPIVFERHFFAVTSAVFSPDGEWVLTTSVDGTARVQRLDRSIEPIVLEGHAGRIDMAAWSPQGDRLVTASWDGTARVWRLATNDLIALLGAASELCLDPDFRNKSLGEPPGRARRHYLECEESYGRSPSPNIGPG